MCIDEIHGDVHDEGRYEQEKVSVKGDQKKVKNIKMKSDPLENLQGVMDS